MIEKSRREPGMKPPARGKGHAALNSQKKVRSEENRENAAMRPSLEAFEERKKLALSSIVFIRFDGKTAHAHLPEGIDPSIPYPVQLQAPMIKLDPASITPESLLTGMLRVLAWDPDNAHGATYRAYVRAVRPELFEELIAAGVQKAESKEWLVAEEIFFAASGLDPERPEPFINLALMHEEHAKLLFDAGDEAQAEKEDELAHKYYQHLLAAKQAFPPAYYHAAFFFLRKHNYDRTVSLLTSYIGMNDDEERTNKAKSILEKLSSMGYLDTLFKEAYDFIQMGEEQKGLERAKQFVDKFPNVWNGWFLVGWAHRRLGNWSEGAQAFATALEKGAEGADVFNELAICQMEMGDLEAARSNLERALRLEPENVKIIVNLGALSYRQGRHREAEGFFRAALEFDPEDRIAKEWLKKFDSAGSPAKPTGEQNQ
jgi:tetratricopeptide (TPR) repeat protein